MSLLPPNRLALSPNTLFWLLALGAALGPAAVQIFLPALPKIAEDFGVSFGTAQLTLSISLISMALSTLVFGPLADRFGRKPIFVLGLVVFVLGSIISTFAPSVWLVIAGRVIQGIGGVAGLIVGRAIVRDLYDEATSAKVISFLMVGMVVGPALAPLVGGAITVVAGWRAVFAFTILIGILMLIPTAWRLEETQQAAPSLHKMRFWAATQILITSRKFMLHALMSAFSMAIFYAIVSGGSYAATEIFGLSPLHYGVLILCMSSSFMLSNVVSGRLVTRVGQGKLIAFGVCMALVAVSGFTLVTIFNPAAKIIFMAPCILLAISNGFVIANATAAAISTEPRIAGTASGYVSFLQLTCSGVVAQIAGWLITESLLSVAFVMISCSLISLCLLAGLRLAPNHAIP